MRRALRPTMPLSGRAGRRWRAGLIAVMAVAVLAVWGLTAVVLRATEPPAPRGGPLLPDLQRVAGEATEVRITTPASRFTVRRSQDRWIIPEKGGYPVPNTRVQTLLAGLESLEARRPLTADPAKFARLGLDDPLEGGNGTRIDITGARGALVGALLVARREGDLFARRPSENQTWAAAGTLPPLDSAAAWIDVDAVRLAASRIARAEIVPPQGRAFILQRSDAATPFALLRPLDWMALQGGGVTGSPAAQAATAIAGWSAVDVKPGPALVSPRAGIQRLVTFDGLVVDVAFHFEDGAVWVRLDAQSADPARAAEVQAFDTAAGPWAWAIAPETARTWLATLDTVAATGAPAR